MSFAVMGTGSRNMILAPNAKDIYDNLRAYILKLRDEHDDLILITGLAEGWDEALGKIGMRENIPYIAAVPTETYGDYYWRQRSLTKRNRIGTFLELLSYAQEVVYVCDTLYVNGVHANFVRNQWMIDHSDFAVVYDAQSPGTRDAVARLETARKPYEKYPFSLQEKLNL